MENGSWETFEAEAFGGREGAIPSDLKLNLRKFARDATLAPAESALVVLAVSRSLGFAPGERLGRALAAEAGIAGEALAEAEAAAGLMGMLNTYYRFKHMLREAGSESLADYERAGLRMTVFQRPALGKERLEIAALAVSIVNGCADCVVSHEKALRSLHIVPEKIHDIARLAAVLKGVADLGIGLDSNARN